jgi:hypothetical protein
VSGEERQAWISGMTQQTAATLVAGAILGVLGLAITWAVMGKRVDTLEETVAAQANDIERKADEATVYRSLADHEARIRAGEVQASATSAALTEVRTDVRWIRETLERDRAKGTR